jgi:hypothetical protein
VRKIDDLSVPGLVGADLDVFREHGYCALRVVPIPHEDDFVFLVILSKTPRAFSKWEDQWLTLLSAALSLAAKQAAVAS